MNHGAERVFRSDRKEGRLNELFQTGLTKSPHEGAFASQVEAVIILVCTCRLPDTALLGEHHQMQRLILLILALSLLSGCKTSGFNPLKVESVANLLSGD
jgi:hypothetical protein